MPGLPGFWSEPTYPDCHKVFIREWKRLVPGELYTINESRMTVNCINGTVIDILSRNADNKNKDIGRGPNYAWGINDEMAYKCDDRMKEKWEDLDNAIRLDTPYLFHDTTSTPKKNTYQHIVERDGHKLITATSWDNPFLPPGYAEQRMADMDKQRAQQELYGLFVALEGLIWDTWSDEMWPNGNISHLGYNKDFPYYLFFDIGSASSAWVLAHQTEHYWVAFAEYTPKRDGSIDGVLRRINEDYGMPCRIVVGHDVNTRDSGSGKSGMFFIRNQWGGGVPVTVVQPGTDRGDKEIQYYRMRFLICDTENRRRFTISRDFKSYDAESRRGVRELMAQDEWPDEKGRQGELLPKEGKLEHVRDALLYGAAGCMAPPRRAKALSTAA